MRGLKVLGATLWGVFVLWMGLLFLTALVSDVVVWGQDHLPRSDDRADLPAYEDHARAHAVFRDAKGTLEEYVPYVEWKRLPMQTEHVNIDADGNRTHRAGVDDDPPGLRVGFFGGSTMWGTGASDDETIPAWFDRLTRGYRVTNYGQGGHVARQNLAQLINLADTGKSPDIVIFYGGYNHAWAHCNYGVTRRLNGHMLEGLLTRSLTERPHFGYLFRTLVDPVREAWLRLRGKRKYIHNEFACPEGSQRAEEVAETLVRIWDIARLVTERYGGRFYAFLQPSAFVGHARVDYVEVKGGGDQLPIVYEAVRRRVAERGLDWVTDVTDAYDGDRPFYLDSAHVTGEANSIMARRILDRLSRDGFGSRAPRRPPASADSATGRHAGERQGIERRAR